MDILRRAFFLLTTGPDGKYFRLCGPRILLQLLNSAVAG